MCHEKLARMMNHKCINVPSLFSRETIIFGNKHGRCTQPWQIPSSKSCRQAIHRSPKGRTFYCFSETATSTASWPLMPKADTQVWIAFPAQKKHQRIPLKHFLDKEPQLKHCTEIIISGCSREASSCGLWLRLGGSQLCESPAEEHQVCYLNTRHH